MIHRLSCCKFISLPSALILRLFLQLRKEILLDIGGLQADFLKRMNHLMWHKRYLNDIHFGWARSFLRPAADIHHTAKRAAAEICFLHDVQYFYAIHLREGDLSGWDGLIDGFNSMIVAEEALHLLKYAFQVPAQAVLFIVPPQSVNDLGELCIFYRCTHRELLPSFMKATEGMTPMAIVQNQFALATQSAWAFGNIYSSWSVELLANMRSAGKPADILNRLGSVMQGL